MPEVSIVTIGYNVAPYIEDTIDSVIAQTHTDWEWIYVDDGSTDNTLDIIRGYNDPRLVILNHEHCANLSVLRNAGAQISKGRYIGFVDGDDIIAPEKIADQVNLFQRNKSVHWSHTNALTLNDETGELTPRGMPLPAITEYTSWSSALRFLLSYNFVYISSMMIRREVFESIGGFNE